MTLENVFEDRGRSFEFLQSIFKPVDTAEVAYAPVS
jgi:hypothetical protein